jgi:TRAP-type mannitol/chloroaromatic compound transport system substrate-binding protein
MHEPGAQLALGMNASWWAGLSKNDQAIIEAACNEENARTMAETNANNGAYLNRLINDHGVQLREFNDDVYEAFGEAAQEVIEEARDHSPLSAKIYDAVVEKRDELGAWTSLSDMAYVQKRNAVLNQ